VLVYHLFKLLFACVCKFSSAQFSSVPRLQRYQQPDGIFTFYAYLKWTTLVVAVTRAEQVEVSTVL
jgi:hypothetical protein